MWIKDHFHRKAGPLVACLVLISLTTVACSGNDYLTREKACVNAANEDAEKLRNITATLLPPAITETVQESNSCDSGANGVYLTFHTGHSTSIDRILQKFQAQGWDTTDPPSEDCVACVKQVEKKFDGRLVRLSILDRPLRSAFEIEVLYI